MKIFFLVLSVLALGQAQVEVRLPFGNPAGVTLTGAGFANNFAFQQPQLQVQPQSIEQPQPIEALQPVPIPAEPLPQQPQVLAAQQHAPFQQHFQTYAAPQVAPVHQFNAYPAPTPLQYHRAVQYAAVAPAPAPVVHQQLAYAPQPAVAVHQKNYYAAPPPPTFIHQQVGYAATPVITKVPGVADVPVTKLAYTQGFTQQEVDVAHPAVSTRKVKVRRPALRKEFYDIEHRVIVRPAGSATLELSQPISKEQQGPAVLTPTKFAHIAPVVRYGASRRILDGDGQTTVFGVRNAPSAAAPASLPERPQPQVAAPRSSSLVSSAQQVQPRQALDEDTEVVEAVQGREDIPQEAKQDQPQPIKDEEPQPAPGNEQPAAQAQEVGRGLTITPDMPLALQSRLLELLTAKGGTVTEILNKDGTPADSASVLQVSDALGDPQLQGGERITTRRIVVTRPIETIQEIEVQEPATKIHRKIIQQPTLFKHHVPAVARVPVAVPAVKHVATPVVKTTYTAAHPAAYSFNYQTPQFSYSH